MRASFGIPRVPGSRHRGRLPWTSRAIGPWAFLIFFAVVGGCDREGEVTGVDPSGARVGSGDSVDVRRFRSRIRTRLAELRPLFEQAGERHGIDWRLLASLAYQESYWDPSSRSQTGVRGIMMLTRVTARELGVQDRLDPEESILGGARYLARLRERLPDDIEEPDRTWMALAAYNLGYGHLRDARRLAAKLDKDPDRWKDLKTVLPLLAREQYYEDLPHGYARGTEPVRMVRRIRTFHQVLREVSPPG